MHPGQLPHSIHQRPGTGVTHSLSEEHPMTAYAQHSLDTAPEASKPILSAIKSKLGFVPNLMATMAESPVLV